MTYCDILHDFGCTIDAYYNKQYDVPHTQVILMSKITIVSGHYDNNFLSLNPKYGTQNYIWGGLTSNLGLPKFQGRKTS